jgi:hypothetical protein
MEIAFVGTHPKGFALFEQVDRSSELWKNLKLVRLNGPAKKHFWHFSWNNLQPRLSGSGDAKLLADQEPEIFQWVLEELGKRAPLSHRQAPSKGKTAKARGKRMTKGQGYEQGFQQDHRGSH